MTDKTALVTAPVTPPTVMPDGWTIHRVAALVRDLAINMYDLPVILKKHGLTEAQHKLLAANEFYQRALEAATIEWNSPQGVKKRLALESAIGIEDALPTLVARLGKTSEPLAAVVPLLKVLAEISGAVGNSNRQDSQVGEKFKIVINLGGDTQNFEKERNPIEVRTITEGEREVEEVFRITEREGETIPR